MTITMRTSNNMRPKDILRYALTIVLLDAAQLAYSKLREKACDRFGIRAGSTPDMTNRAKEAVFREVDENVNTREG